MQQIVPMLAYEDAAGAIDWLCRAFGFEEDASARYSDADGVIGHAELQLEGDRIMLATPTKDYRSPKHHRETCADAARWQDNPWVIDGVYVQVRDVDAHCERARAAGATIMREPADPGVGVRLYSAEDPEGHRWMFAERR